MATIEFHSANLIEIDIDTSDSDAMESYYQINSTVLAESRCLSPMEWLDEKVDELVAFAQSLYGDYAEVVLVSAIGHPMPFTFYVVIKVAFSDKQRLNKFKLLNPETYHKMVRAQKWFEQLKLEEPNVTFNHTYRYPIGQLDA